MVDNSGNVVPKWIDKYKILKELGGGGYGLVYLVNHVDFPNRYYALKLLKSRFMSSEKEKARFLQEAHFLEVIKGPNILPIEAFGFFKDIPYIVTEYIGNGSLRDLLEMQPSQPISIDKSLTILSTIGRALTTIHQISIVHGDLKPENILLRDQDQAILSDFGNATFLGTMDIIDIHEVRGTFAYMSPEQFRGMVGRSSDQYALGCIAYELFTGQHPFIANDFKTWKLKHETEMPRTLREIIPSLESNIELATLIALAKEPDKRHVGVTEFVQHLYSSTNSAGSVLPNSTSTRSPHVTATPHTVILTATNIAPPPIVQQSDASINEIGTPIISTPQGQVRNRPPSLHELQLPFFFVQLLTPALIAANLTIRDADAYRPKKPKPYTYTQLLRNEEVLRCLLHIDDQFLADIEYFDNLTVMLEAFKPDQFLIIFLGTPHLPPIQLRNLLKSERNGNVNYITKKDLDELFSLPLYDCTRWLDDALELGGLLLENPPPNQLEANDFHILADILSRFEQMKNDTRFWPLLFITEGLEKLGIQVSFNGDDRYAVAIHVVRYLERVFVIVNREKRNALGLLLTRLLKYSELPQDFYQAVLTVIDKYKLVPSSEYIKLKENKQ